MLDAANRTIEQCFSPRVVWREVRRDLRGLHRARSYSDRVLAYSEITTLSLRRPVPPRGVVPELVGDYELGRCLGHGGMGMVFEARHRLLDRRAAVKVIRPELRDNHESQLRLSREARALARIEHPNVVALYEMSGLDGNVFIAMEMLDGGTLREWMQTPHDWREVIAMFARFGRGLAAAHELGFVHRDVNPANIFLARDGTPKLGDFGLVCSDGDPALRSIQLDAALFERGLTLAGSVLGTQAYMAPEQKQGDHVGAAADQYAFCASLHEALVGDVPRDGELGALPVALHRVLARGLAPRPEARFPSLRALLAALPG